MKIEIDVTSKKLLVLQTNFTGEGGGRVTTMTPLLPALNGTKIFFKALKFL